jgi:hypothetical protein
MAADRILLARGRGVLHAADDDSRRNGNRTLCGPVFLEKLPRRTVTTYQAAADLLARADGCQKCRRSPRLLDPRERRGYTP